MRKNTVVILQSNYLPWKGYFDLIGLADLFIFYDDVQFTKNDWRNRNKIKTVKGVEWLSVPCGTNLKRLICEVELKDYTWQSRHWMKIADAYRDTAYFEKFSSFFEDFYTNNIWQNLSDMNQYLIRKIAREMLGMTTEVTDSRAYGLIKHKGERVLELLEKVGATEYLSGSSAKSYLDPEEFKRRGIKLTWMDYSGYPEYRQLYPPFVHEVSVIDLIFNEGPNARKYLKSSA
jgi:WbqC-like protein family